MTNISEIGRGSPNSTSPGVLAGITTLGLIAFASLLVYCGKSHNERRSFPQNDRVPSLEVKSNRVYTIPSQYYIIQTSTDLVNWVNINAGEGFTDRQRFFRYGEKI